MIDYTNLVINALIYLSKFGIRKVSTSDLIAYEKAIFETSLMSVKKENADFLFEIEGYLLVINDEYIVVPTISTNELRKFRSCLSVESMVALNNKYSLEVLYKHVVSRKSHDIDKELAFRAIDDSYEKIRQLENLIIAEKAKIEKIARINNLGEKIQYSKSYSQKNK